MADIDVQRKKGPGVWPWIAGLVVLALVIWGITQMGADRTAMDDPATTPAAEQWPATEPAPGWQEPAPGVSPEPDDPVTPAPQPGDPAAPGTTPPGTTDPPAQDPPGTGNQPPR